ncbi:hypothetical protein PTE01_35500 [Pseudoalteromonas tetraodonis GFC]|uniref:LRAT domain-containing protein n=1 Tax=Pseudoalteromonas tetraodonis GFC TaxID=1315271 RepID=A0AA37S4D4_9GAMM|nr:lecithin retinol acyltransferase family protein [Pseudoalteromonas tetraodonis]ATD02344.1 hypothetical protein PTET_a0829 [Pseudoalteromonas tetraodonis]GEN40440.1 hypothetical protein PTE01_35500 [Pseudoalteromonas tetraodonis GFC]GLQ03929.1 hypothetical protein GCM10007914_28100 [Pseudoalteromonas tetraodonis GFC]
MNLYNVIGHFLIGNLSKSLAHNLFWKTDGPVRGSIVYCDLAFGVAEHSGIYLGNNQIIHKNAMGLIETVSVYQFLAGTSAITIYISCDANGTSVGFDDIANDAETLLGTQQAYSVLSKNCHQFCSYCITGNIHTNTFTLAQLKHDAREYIKASQWRAWDLTKR